MQESHRADSDLWVNLRLADDLSAVGGKASRLGQLMRHGIDVPSGGVVPVAAHVLRQRGELTTADLATHLRRQLVREGYGPAQLFAVRSSAAVEDSGSASFAGLFRSLLGVPLEEVPAAVIQVQDSATGPAVSAYSQRLSVRAPDAMAVIVQEMVQPQRAGVCFTVDPVNAAAEVIVEYAEGLSEAMLGGRESPAGTVRFPRGDGLAVTASGEPDGLGLAQVARLALRLEALLGRPQDVEWAIDGSTLWILQSRPVTTLARYAAGQHSPRDTADTRE